MKHTFHKRVEGQGPSAGLVLSLHHHHHIKAVAREVFPLQGEEEEEDADEHHCCLFLNMNFGPEATSVFLDSFTQSLPRLPASHFCDADDLMHSLSTARKVLYH